MTTANSSGIGSSIDTILDALPERADALRREAQAMLDRDLSQAERDKHAERFAEIVAKAAEHHSKDGKLLAALNQLTGQNDAGELLTAAAQEAKTAREANAVRIQVTYNGGPDNVPVGDAIAAEEAYRKELAALKAHDSALHQLQNGIASRMKSELSPESRSADAPATARAEAPRDTVPTESVQSSPVSGGTAEPNPVAPAAKAPKTGPEPKFVTQVPVEGSEATVNAEMLQKAIKMKDANANLGHSGAHGDGVDNKAGTLTAKEFNRVFRNNTTPQRTDELALTSKELEEVRKLAAEYDKQHARTQTRESAREPARETAPGATTAKTAPAQRNRAGATKPDTVDYKVGPEVANLNPELIKQMVAFGGDADKGRTLDGKWLQERAALIDQVYKVHNPGQTRPFNEELAAITQKPVVALGPTSPEAPVMARSDAPAPKVAAAPAPAQTAPAQAPAKTGVTITPEVAAKYNLDDIAKELKVAGVNSGVIDEKAKLNLDALVRDRYLEKHPERNRRGGMSGITVGDMVADLTHVNDVSKPTAVALADRPAGRAAGH